MTTERLAYERRMVGVGETDYADWLDRERELSER
jgi:hypothetical protein